MRILFVDDMRERLHQFKSKSGGAHDIAYACCVSDAKRILGDAGCVFDLVLLDHDMAEPHYSVDCVDDETGTGLASWIAERADRFRSVTFAVHSLNPSGRARMALTLLDAGLRAIDAPWGWMWDWIGKAPTEASTP